MALIKAAEEIKILREGGQILAKVLQKVSEKVAPDISTWDLDQIARKEIKKFGAEAAFPGYRIAPDIPPYPAALCTSVNNEVVHGIPKKERLLEEGDIIGLDLGVRYKGLFTDAAITVAVGKVSSERMAFLDATKVSLEKGLEEIKPGNTLGDIAAAISSVAKAGRFGVIRDLGGHGVGHAIHEDPFVPNFGKPGSLQKLEVGMVLAIEPMFTMGDWRVKFLEDGWTVVTADGSIAAHFEDTVVVTTDGCEVLTRQ